MTSEEWQRHEQEECLLRVLELKRKAQDVRAGAQPTPSSVQQRAILDAREEDGEDEESDPASLDWRAKMFRP